MSSMLKLSSHVALTVLALQFGQSALHYASIVGEIEYVKVLVKYGAQVDLPVRYDVQKRIHAGLGCSVWQLPLNNIMLGQPDLCEN